MIVVLLGAVTKLADLMHLSRIDYFAQIAFQCFLNTLTGFMLFFLIRKVLRDDRAAAAGFMIYVLLIGLSPWVSIPYSDSIALIFPVSVLLLYFMQPISGMIPTTPIVSMICFAVLAALAALILYYMTKNVTVSAVIGGLLVAIIIFFYALDASLFEGALPSLLRTFALFQRFYDFTYGIFNLKDVIFYLSFTAFFLFLTGQSLDKKRWS
jgi:ABC-2 type transport system permease protein